MGRSSGGFSVDGVGVVPDLNVAPHGVPAGYRLRAHLTEEAGDDVSVWVADGYLYVAGHYGRLLVEQQAENMARVRCVRPRAAAGEGRD